jgi:survival of motor neuron protein-interacting protein 1
MEISSLETMDAMEYLASVKAQASSLPDVFVSQKTKEDASMSVNGGIDAIDGSAAARDYLFSHRLDILPPPSRAYAPSKNNLSPWKENTLSNFSSLRLYMSTCCETLRGATTTEERIKVPKSKDLYAWHVFCLGEHGRNEMESRMVDVQLSDLNYDANAVEIDLELSKYNIPSGGFEPTTKLLSQFDQIIIRRLLSHHTKYVSAGCTITLKRMKWIYAVLARLEKPIHRDEASVLTELLRSLSRARAKVNLGDDNDRGEDGEIMKAINVVILLVGLYFEQCMDFKRLLVAKDGT